jgi:hypothetical protein
MKTINTLVLLLAAAVCLSCSGGQQSADDTAAARSQIQDEITLMANAINREDAASASLPASSRLWISDNVRARFPGGEWPANGIVGCRAFFSTFFAVNANIEFDAKLTEWFTVKGDTATALVEVNLNSTRIDRIPPEAWAAGPYVDYFIFQRESGAWRLITWSEGPEHLQGEGETL